MSTPDGWGEQFDFSKFVPSRQEVHTEPDFYDHALMDSDIYLNLEPDHHITVEAKPGTIENPIDIHLKYKPEWTADQRRQADEKLKAESEAVTMKTEPPKHRKPIRKLYMKKYNISKDKDVDHVIDLQLGGKDDMMNTQLLDRSVNRSLGAQIHHAIKDYEVGTYIGEISIK